MGGMLKAGYAGFAYIKTGRGQARPGITITYIIIYDLMAMYRSKAI
jgi:hypothetical protein